MAVTAKFYGNALVKAFNKEIDLDTDTIKLAFLDNTHVLDQDTHDYFDDVVADEIAATGGYTAGGVTLTGCSISYDGATNKFKFDADDVDILTSTITARIGVVYDATPATDGTRPLVLYVDFGEDVSSSGGTFAVDWDIDGIGTITVA